jgi:hypothetical protein
MSTPAADVAYPQAQTTPTKAKVVHPDVAPLGIMNVETTTKVPHLVMTESSR